MQPLVSIIIPTFNRCHLIGETLDSVLAQTYSNWECIVVDDGSTDYTEELLEFYLNKDSRFFYYKRPKEKPKGANACRNYGFEKSGGDFIQWFDSDDLMNNEYSEKAVYALEKNKEIDFVFFNYKVFEKGISNILFGQENSSKKALEDYFSGKINFSTCGIVWKRQSISSVDFNEKLSKSQELDFIFNNYKNTQGKLSGEFIDYCAYYLRKHESSIVSSFKLAQPQFLLSDIYVRNQILNYYTSQFEIEQYQSEELQKSIYFFLLNASGKQIFKHISASYSIMELAELFFYRWIFKITGREFRFKKILKGLSKRKVDLKF